MTDDHASPKHPLPWWVIALLIVASIGFVALSVRGFWIYANHDRLELIDRTDVVAAVESACADLDRGVAELQTDGAKVAGRARAERIDAENDTIGRMVARVKELGREVLEDDRPTQAWLRDWETLAATRRDYAAALRTNAVTPPPKVPTDEGSPITERRGDVGIECDIPAGILDDVRV